jgi:hypothetical protein
MPILTVFFLQACSDHLPPERLLEEALYGSSF